MNENRGLHTLYRTFAGRCALKLLTAPALSRAAGYALSSGASRALIGGFVRRNKIDMSDYADRRYKSFNDFFTRELVPGARKIDMDADALIAPCDGKLSVYRITSGVRLTVKSQSYSVAELLGGNASACLFGGGLALVFRLCVDDYHRYSFFDGGHAGEHAAIAGKLHTVRPIALDSTRVFAQNSREYTILHTDNFGIAAQIEVGAMMVGRIKNPPPPARFERGAEKGMFEFGGSTVVLLLRSGEAEMRRDLAALIGSGEETRVLLGERIGGKPRVG